MIEREGGTVISDGEMLPPLHPGEVLREEFMKPLGLSAVAVAQACRVPRARIERIAREEMAVTVDTALRLSRLFGNSAEFWMGLQADFDLQVGRSSLAEELAKIEPREAA